MNGRKLIVVALALVCGLSAMVLVRAIRRPPSGPVVEKTPAVFASADIRPGDTIEESMLEVREIPKEEVPEDAIRKVADAVGRAAMSQLDAGDMLRGKKLADKGAGRGMAALIRPGMRAFTIQTPSFSSSLAGFILPGNRVDVLLTTSSGGGPGDETGGGTASTLLQNVEILAVHTTVNRPSNNKISPDEARSVTLLVSPEEVELLDLGQNKGTLHLSLRNLQDGGTAKPRPATMADLLHVPRKGPEVAAAPPAPAPPPPSLPPLPVFVTMTVRTLRGTAVGQDVLTVVLPPPSSPGPSPSPSPAPARMAAPQGAVDRRAMLAGGPSGAMPIGNPDRDVD